MMHRLFYTVCSLLLFCLPLIAQEKQAGESIIKEWERTLEFGIDSEVIEVVKKLKDYREVSMNGRLTAVLAKSVNPNVRKEIIDFFIDVDYRDAEAVAFTILQNHENEDPDLIRSLIGYLAHVKSSRSLPLFMELVNSENNILAYSAITAIGKTGDTSKAPFLLEKLRDPEINTNRKPTIIIALGELKAKEAMPELLKIIENRSEDNIWRMYAAEALGKIADPSSVPALKKIFSENDPLLKAYAASALANFDLSQVIDVLMEGLKDSHWKVRVAACQGLARPDAAKAIDILIYKVEKDPEMKVKTEAIKALGAIGTERSFAFLRKIMEDNGKPIPLRDFAFGTLVEKNLSGETLAAIERLVAAEWETKDKTLLESVSRRLMYTESPSLGKIYGLFLNHPSFVVRVAGIRGIAKNRYYDLRGRLEELKEKDRTEPVRKEAGLALEKF